MTFVKMVTLPLPSQNPFCLSFIRTLEIAFGPARIISGFLTESHLNLFCQRRCHLQVSRVRTLNLWYLLFSLPHKLVKKIKRNTETYHEEKDPQNPTGARDHHWKQFGAYFSGFSPLLILTNVFILFPFLLKIKNGITFYTAQQLVSFI